MELWRPIPGFEGTYEVSNEGQVRRLRPSRGTRPGRILRWQSNGVYPKVCLSLGSKVVQKYVHHLVLESFVGPCPPGHTASHVDDNPWNNELVNLRWEPHQRNCERRSENRKNNGLPPAGWASRGK